MDPIEISSLSDPHVDDYRNVRDAELRSGGRFIVEGRLNVRRLIETSPFRVRSLLLTPTAYQAMRECALRVARAPHPGQVYVASQVLLNEIVGYNMHRGCLAVAERGEAKSLANILGMAVEGSRERPQRPGNAQPPSGARGVGNAVVVALDHLNDQENVGGVYRNAMAFGVDAVLLSPRCCDPLFRKALRVSMGGALRIPTARAQAGDWPGELERLRSAGFEVVGLDPGPAAEPIDRFRAKSEVGTVLVAGAEGPGLSPEVRAVCNRSVCIPMVAGVDSLNVATSVAIALQHFTRERLGAAAGAHL